MWGVGRDRVKSGAIRECDRAIALILKQRLIPLLCRSRHLHCFLQRQA